MSVLLRALFWRAFCSATVGFQSQIFPAEAAPAANCFESVKVPKDIVPLRRLHAPMDHTSELSPTVNSSFVPMALGALVNAGVKEREQFLALIKAQQAQLAELVSGVEAMDTTPDIISIETPRTGPSTRTSLDGVYGRTPETVVRASMTEWHAPHGKAMPTASETLLIGTSMVATHSDDALSLWTTRVLREKDNADALGDMWVPPQHDDEWNSKGKIIVPLLDALRRYDKQHTAACAELLAGWSGEGGMDGVLPGHSIKHYFEKLVKPKWFLGPKRNSKGHASPRYVSATISVAKLLRAHGPALRAAYLSAYQNTKGSTSLMTKVEMQQAMEATREEKADVEERLTEKLTTERERRERVETAHRQQLHRQQADRATITQKVKAKLPAIRQKEAEKAAAAVEQKLVDERDAALADAANANRLRNNANKRARNSDSAKEKAEQLAQDRLTTKQKAEAEVEELKQDREETHDQLAASAEALTKLAQIPAFIPLRGAGMGRGALRHPPVMYTLGMTQLAAAVSPSAVPSLVVNAVKTITPWATVVAPCVDWVRRLRRMLPIACEALGAYRIGKAIRVAQLGSDATSRSGGAHKGRVPLMTAGVVCDFENSDGSTSRAAVVSRAAYVTPGETAEIEVDAVAKGAFDNGVHLLIKWDEVHREMFPVFKGHKPSSIPNPKLAGLHRLAGGLLITDTCSGALCFRRLMIALIAKRVEEEIGEADWLLMDEQERADAVKVYEVDCFGHLRNLQIEAGAAAVSSYLKEQLQEELATVPPIYRLTTDGMDPIRTVYKQFSRDGVYAKGDGLDFGSWLVSDRPKACYLPLQRADHGRQDLVVEGAISVYMDRGFYDDFLYEKLHDPEHSNLLEDHVWITLTAPSQIAMLRCNAIIGYAVSMPFRFLAGSSHLLKDWSPFSMALVMDVLEQFMECAAADGRLLLNANVNIFEAFEKQQPAFAEWCRDLENETILSPDGKVRHRKWQMVRRELFAPAEATNRASSELTRKLLEVFAQGVLDKMRDPKLARARYLSSQDGARAWEGAHAEETSIAHEATMGLLATNDILAESTFGTFTYYFNTHKGISVAAASGVAQARINGDFKCTDDFVRHRKSKKQKAVSGEPLWSEGDHGLGQGLFHNLTAEEQASLVEMARRELDAATARDKATYARLLAYRAEKRREFLAKAEVKLQEIYIDALYYFEQYHSEGCPKSLVELERDWAWVKAIESSTAQTEWLKDQILTRVVGFGWSDFKCAWSKKDDPTVGSIPTLLAHLRKIVAAEAARPIPTEAHCPMLKRKTLPQLGDPTIKVEELDVRAGSKSSTFKSAAVREKEKREAEGIGDKWQNAQPTVPPPFDASLVGTQLEIRTSFDLPEAEGGGVTWLWCMCKVLQVSDGTVRRISEKTGKMLTGVYPVGWVLLRWAAIPDLGEPEETEQWMVLDRRKWKGDQKNSWRKNLEEASWLA